MLDRRALLARAVGGLLGGGLLTGTATGSETEPEPPRSDVSVRLDASVLDLTGVPRPLEPTIEELEQSTGVSRTDIDALSASGTVRAGTLTDGWATATGTFDARRTARQLEARFAGVQRTGQEPVRAAFEQSSRRNGNSASEETVHVLVNREESVAVGIQPSRIVLGTAPDVETARRRLGSTLRPAVTNRTESGVLDRTLTGDAVAYATVGDELPTVLEARVDALPAQVVELLFAVRRAGVALDAGRKTTQIRHAAQFDPPSASSGAVSTFLETLAGIDEVDLHRSDAGRHSLVTDVRVPTASLWRTHAEALGW